MPRIPEEEIERLKRETDLAALVERYGVKLEAKGKDLAGLCPFHDDRGPSLIVTPGKNLWHCLGACQTGGTVIDWVMKAENVSFRHAVELLRTTDNKIAATPLAAKEKTTRGPDLAGDAETRELLSQVVDFYHQALKDSPEALSYLAGRGLNHPELLDRFRLGYANRTLGYRLPDKQLKSGAQLRGRLQELGILRESGHEHFNGSVVVPVFDEAGGVAEMYGRKTLPKSKLRPGTPLHLYLPGPHHGVWNVEALAASREIILCEALIDAMTFWCHDFRHVTASYGVNGFTEDHLAAFQRYGTERVLIAYDNDEAGNGAAEKVAQTLAAAGISSTRIRFPAGLDANEFALRAKDAGQDLLRLIQTAEPLGLVEPAKSTAPQVQEKNKEAANEEAAEEKAAPEEAAKEKEPAEKTAKTPQAVSSLAAGLVAAPPAVPAEVRKEEILITLGDRKWRIRGLAKNLSYEQMKVNVLVSLADNFFVDTLDLYSARLRAMFTKQAATELELNEDVVKSDLGKVFLKLEELQDGQIKQALEPKKPEVVMSEAETEAALRFLKDPRLLERILCDFEKCGVVGEETGKLVGYLAAVSRKLDSPLAVIIQSSSAAGKTWLMENILSFVPEEERVKYSAMTGQSLFYLGETDLKNKVLAIVEEEGAERASYALKLLQSEGELSIASTGKDPQTGKLVTHEYRVEGPVMIFITTTSIDIDEELQNRCLMLSVNESREQTRAIHQRQRERRTLLGLQSKLDRAEILKAHRNAQRLLRPLKVVNRYAPSLTFLDDRTRTRRDHEKYLNLIEAIALLHQYQRPVKTMTCGGGPVEYIEVELSDIETANGLAGEVLGRSLCDIPPQTRRLLDLVHQMVSRECGRLGIEPGDYRFSRRQVCEHSRWSLTQVRHHLDRLVDQEYILTHRGGRGQSFVYELVYRGEGKEGEAFLVGLIDAERLQKARYGGNLAGLAERVAGGSGEIAGSKRPQNGVKTGGWRGDEIPPGPPFEKGFRPLVAGTGENAYMGDGGINRSRNRTHGDGVPRFSSLLELRCFQALLAAKEKEFAGVAASLPQAAASARATVPGNGR